MKSLVNNSVDPHFNLAFDEWCLEHWEGEPVFYLWRNRPSVIIGLNQNAYSEVNLGWLRDNGVDVARRVTGGGAVYHDLQNLNYTSVGKGVTPQPFADALRKLGVPAEVSGRNDIFVGGRKVSGYARRVWHDREIVHGTLMYDVDIDSLVSALAVPGSKLMSKGIASVRSRVTNLKPMLPSFGSLDEVQSALAEILGGGDEVIMPDEAFMEGVRRLADGKFRTWDWVYGHSREADFSRSAVLPCGTVSVQTCTDHGLITGVVFTGDFIGDLPPEGVSEVLKGVRLGYGPVLEALGTVDVGSFFHRTGPEEIARLVVPEGIL